MKARVIDASVAVKWVQPEELSAEAQLLVSRYPRLIVPDFLYLEVANTLWKRAQRKELTTQETFVALEGICNMVLEVVPAKGLLDSAMAFALQTKRTLYDSVYLALALDSDCKLVTADRRFFNAIGQSGWGKYVDWLGDMKDD